MPHDIVRARHIQGGFQNHLARGYDPAQHGSAPANVLTGRGPLRIRNSSDCLVALLLLSTALRRPTPPHRGPTAPDAARARGGAPLPGALAISEDRHGLLQESDTSRNLQNIANGVIARCVTRPTECSTAVKAGAVATVGVLASGTLGFLAGLAARPNCTADDGAPKAIYSSEVVLAALPADARQQVWAIVQHCDGEPACAEPEIRAVLETLEPMDQERLLAQLPAELSERAPRAAWLPGADAGVVLPSDWIEHVAHLLGTEITAEEAAFELDIAAIADATRASQERPGSIVKRRYFANDARLSEIEDRFERDGRNVEQRPFNLTTRTLFGFPYQSIGRNLLVTLSGEGPVERTLMLVAHGDVVAAEIGSTGALDNGSGVATLLALARRLAGNGRAGEPRGLPPGTRVQFLVTDREEDGLHGAKAYVEECLDAMDCPDATIVVDLMGEGEGMTLSGSDMHPLYRDGDSLPRGVDATPVSAEEAQLRQLLETAAAAIGLRVHETPGWTLQSDHIAFQRAGRPALGVSLMNAADIPLERARQDARNAFMLAEEAVDWRLYEGYLDGTLNATQSAQMERDLDTANAATDAYQALPPSGRQHLIHSAADQPERINTRHALRAITVLHRAIRAWLSAPRPRGEP
jgi:hypothetical protein